MSTLKEVAKHAGVSVSTASMAVRDHHLISIETKRKVWEAQEKLGYRTNLMPRPVAREAQESEVEVKTILYLLIDRQFEDPVYSRSFEGISRALEVRNWRSVFAPGSLEKLHKGEFPAAIRNREVDGIIVTGVYDEKAHRNLSRLGIPIVVLGNYYLGDEPWMACEVDLAHGMRQAVKRLEELGHQKFALFLRAEVSEYQHKLRQWYTREMSEQGRLDMGIIRECDQGNVHEALSGLFEGKDRPTVLILETSTVSEEVYDFCEENRIRIPEDLNILAFGSDIWRMRPTLACVRILGEDYGVTAMNKLARLIENPEATPTRELFPMRFVPGGSIGSGPQS